MLAFSRTGRSLLKKLISSIDTMELSDTDIYIVLAIFWYWCCQVVISSCNTFILIHSRLGHVIWKLFIFYQFNLILFFIGLVLPHSFFLSLRLAYFIIFYHPDPLKKFFIMWDLFQISLHFFGYGLGQTWARTDLYFCECILALFQSCKMYTIVNAG